MSTVHPSRMGMVPGGGSVSSPRQDQDEEHQLRQRLLQSQSDRRDGDRNRRRSPSYQPYSNQHTEDRPPPPSRWDRQPPTTNGPGDRRRYFEEGPPPPGAWNRGPRMNGGEMVDHRGGHGGYSANAGANAGGDFFSSRNAQRQASTLSIWPPSPKEPYESEDEAERKRKRRRHEDKKHSSSRSKSSRHRDYHESSSSRRSRRKEDDDDDERRRRRRSRSRSDSRREEEDSSKRRSHHHRSSRHHRSDRHDRSKRSRRSRSRSDDDDRRPDSKDTKPASGDEDDTEIGPQLPLTSDGQIIDPRSYGSALLPGEGSAMAAYVQDGKRIPRRGEIGLSSEQIEDYEKAGFVMSGSRHARMNAVRVRKENQIYSAEEKRELLKLQREEREKKEREIVGQFKEMLDRS
ncbi:unnamed protein product [Sympodiomycopsis kandeliae]